MSRFTDIDFIQRPRMPRWAVMVLLPLLALLLLAAWRYAGLRTALDTQTRELQSRQRQRVAAPAPAVTEALSMPRAEAINGAVAALNTPWPALLGAIETVRSEQIQLTQLEPHPHERRVLITAQAADMEQLIDFMQALATTAPFVQARPLHQQMVADAVRVRAQASFELRWESYR